MGTSHPSTKSAANQSRSGAATTPTATIGEALSLLYAGTAEGSVELRAIGIDGRKSPLSKWFALSPVGFAQLAGEASKLTTKARGVYFTLNPASPDSGKPATDKDVLRRRWLLLDVDPVRPSETSATDAEHADALDRADQIKEYLGSRGWPAPITADSGNGAHLLYRVDLPNDAQARDLIKNCLIALASRFDDATVKVDTAVFNASRICRLYGTWARKGQDTPDRPHRVSGLVDVPKLVEAVPESALVELASEAPGRKARPEQADRREAPGRKAGASTAPYAVAALAGELAILRAAAVGDRNQQLFKSAAAMAELVTAGALDHATTWDALASTAADIGLDGPEIESTMRSAFKAGSSNPRDLSGVGTKARSSTNSQTNGTGARNGTHATSTDTDEGTADQVERSDGTQDEDRPNEAPDDPHRLARIYLRDRCQHDDGHTLIHWRGSFWRWEAGAYRECSEKELRAQIGQMIKSEFDELNRIDRAAWRKAGGVDQHGKPTREPLARKVSVPLVTNAMAALCGLALVPGSIMRQAPAWLDTPPPWPAGEVLPAGNMLLHLPSLVDGKPAAADPTPRLFSTWALDYPIALDAPAPAEWMNFLDTLWPDDPESIDTLQEWFGYCLTPDTRLQKILALIGPLRSGKGTIARVLTKLLGSVNVASPGLGSLGTQFGLAPMIGKPLAIVSDARLGGRADQASVVENLLRISGEDSVSIDRKHQESWVGRLPTRFVLITNELPRLTDSSGALAGRLVLLRLTRSFYGQEDLDLERRLTGEMSGVLLWAIEGWRRLRERGRLVQPASGRELVEDMENLSSPVGAFVAERLDVRPGLATLCRDVYHAWCQWCEVVGRDRPGDEQNFGRSMRAVLPALKVQPTRRAGVQVRLYLGLGLKGGF
ncbi:MAG: DNA primase family protein [Candidatus Nanopelagicales bacterium]